MGTENAWSVSSSPSHRLGHCSRPITRWPLHGWRAAGEECQMEGLLPAGRPELQQVGAGPGWSLCACGPAKQSHVTSCRTQRGFCPMLCILMTYIQRSQGRHSERGLKHLGNCTSGKLPLHCLFWSTTSPGRDCPWKEVPVCTRSRPHHVPPSALDGEERNAAHTDPSLVTCHRGHKRPAVRLGVVHLHRAQV